MTEDITANSDQEPGNNEGYSERQLTRVEDMLGVGLVR